jgi:hypothetical protein
MSDEQKMEFIGSAFCTQYHCEAGFYIEPPGSGKARPCAGRWVRHLMVRYGKGYTGQHLPFNRNGERATIGREGRRRRRHPCGRCGPLVARG